MFFYITAVNSVSLVGPTRMDCYFAFRLYDLVKRLGILKSFVNNKALIQTFLGT